MTDLEDKRCKLACAIIARMLREKLPITDPDVLFAVRDDIIRQIEQWELDRVHGALQRAAKVNSG